MANEPNDASHIVESLYEAGQAMMRQLGAAGASGAEPAATPADPMAQFIAATQQMAALQQAFVKQMGTYWGGVPWLALEAPGATAVKDEDKRFAAGAWRDDPRFDLVRKTYTAYANFLQSAVALLGAAVRRRDEPVEFLPHQSGSDAACRRDGRPERRAGNGAVLRGPREGTDLDDRRERV